MTTRAQLRSALRSELNDSGGTPLWSDAQLNEYLNQGIRGYGRSLPREAATTVTVVADQAAYALPSDFERAIRVEQPDEVIRVFDPQERSSWGYRIWAGQLVLAPEPTSAGATQNVTLDYLARFAEPAADGDTISTPASDDDVLIRLAASLALLWIDSDEAKRQRFERQRGSSARAQAQVYYEQAMATIEQRRRRLRGTALVV